MLHRGKVGLREFNDEAIADPGILKLARKLKFTQANDTGYPGAFPGWVRIRLHDGRVLERRMLSNRGSPDNPARDDEIIGKYEDNASLMLPRQQADQLRDLVMNLENVRDLRTLAANMRP